MTGPLLLDATATVWSVPEEQRADLPLVIVMHGRGSDENDLAALFAELPGDVRLRVGAGADRRRTGMVVVRGRRTATTSGDPTPENADRAADAVLDWLDGLGWAPPLVGTLGFSQGGAMSTHVLRRDPGRVRFAVNLAGFIVARRPADRRRAGRRAATGVLGPRRRGRALHPRARGAHRTPGSRLTPMLDAHVYPGLAHSISRDELDDVVSLPARTASPVASPLRAP